MITSSRANRPILHPPLWWFAHSMSNSGGNHTIRGPKQKAPPFGDAPEHSCFLSDGLLLVILLGQFIDFLLQFLDHFFLGNFSDDLAVSEQQALTTGAGDADIGFFRLTGTVYGAAEHRYLDR